LRCERPGWHPVFQNIGAVSADPKLLPEVYRGLGWIPSPRRVVRGPIPQMRSARRLVRIFAFSPACQATVTGLGSVAGAPACASHPILLVRLIDTEEYV
jgi:hypothetical protein